MTELVNHLKEYGFVFPGSEVYGGLASAWDYGPLGSLVKRNIKNEWYKFFVENEENIFLVDTNILMNPKVWEASGHIKKFVDSTVVCKKCNSNVVLPKPIKHLGKDGVIEDKSAGKASTFFSCPVCKNQNFEFSRTFNLLFSTYQGVIEGQKRSIYLRPETAQGIFVNFPRIMRSMRSSIPFGVAQIGKVFRNEITPGNFIFKTPEFEQMEIEYFTTPNKGCTSYQNWISKSLSFLLSLGVSKANLRKRIHSNEELAHYSSATTDFEYKFPFGWGEIAGVSQRNSFDLMAHQKHSGTNMQYLNVKSKSKEYPCVVEPTFGLNRLLLMVLLDSYIVEKQGSKTRVFLKLKPSLAPYHVAVLPLVKKLSPYARTVFKALKKKFYVLFDDSGSIGKRYFRQDCIGTPWCVTFDYQSIEDKMVTIRNRDSTLQKRVLISKIWNYL